MWQKHEDAGNFQAEIQTLHQYYANCKTSKQWNDKLGVFDFMTRLEFSSGKGYSGCGYKEMCEKICRYEILKKYFAYITKKSVTGY